MGSAITNQGYFFESTIIFTSTTLSLQVCDLISKMFCYFFTAKKIVGISLVVQSAPFSDDLLDQSTSLYLSTAAIFISLVSPMY